MIEAKILKGKNLEGRDIDITPSGDYYYIGSEWIERKTGVMQEDQPKEIVVGSKDDGLMKMKKEKGNCRERYVGWGWKEPEEDENDSRDR